MVYERSGQLLRHQGKQMAEKASAHRGSKVKHGQDFEQYSKSDAIRLSIS